MKKICILILLSIIVYPSCQSPSNGDNVPVENNYVSFSQAIYGLITGMININGILTLVANDLTTVNIPINNGSFAITRDYALVAGTYKVILTTDEGLTLEVPDADLGENGLYLPRSHRLINNVIEKEEAMKNYLSSVNPEQLSEVEQMLMNWNHYARTKILPAKKKYLKQLEKRFIGTDSAVDGNRLSKTRDKILKSIERIESDQYNLCDLYEDSVFRTSEIWLQPPTIVIYDRSVWNYSNNQWVKVPAMEGQIDFPQFLTKTVNYYAAIAYQYFEGLTGNPFNLLIESANDEMPNPNIETSNENDPRYIFFLINDNAANYNMIFRNITFNDMVYDDEVYISWVSMPYNLYYWDQRTWMTLKRALFWSLKVWEYFIAELSPSIPFEDENENPSAIMKLVGKIKNNRDPGHILVLEQGEYYDKYGYYPD
jgi:hypothetical protein